ncbi:uncharacterized protein N7529_002141 [Penicillium soppii]|uniref:uncharacterized protein n=1 Tax=Penicillium soppii TaxID=69789 RepID=UPI002549B16C|nr:uncharacterized protein N7529_002141 [Penicillium soppii]KAJ5873711.1 hypothetical protein N7529_002141 [Penicillium soppii]
MTDHKGMNFSSVLTYTILHTEFNEDVRSPECSPGGNRTRLAYMLIRRGTQVCWKLGWELQIQLCH